MTAVRSRTSASRFLDDLASCGRYHFTVAEAERSVTGTPTAVRAALRRLKQKHLIAEPVRGFVVALPPEYRKLGCLPPEQFVPQLMAYWDEPYYTALLSAAELHGAAHHRPQRFQVMLERNRRPIVCGKVHVEFVARKDLATTPVDERNTPRGTLRFSTAEATALELVGYPERCGGLDNVATVVAELAERIDKRKLVAEARRAPAVWVQRLGYLLELVGRESLASSLEPLVAKVSEEAPLVRSRSRRGAIRDHRWKLAVNTTVEPDL